MNKITLLPFRDFAKVAFLQKNPQDILITESLSRLTLFLYGLISFLHSLIYEPIDRAIQIAFLNLFLLLVLMYFWLSLFGLKTRWLQTVTAIAGSSCVIGLVAIVANVVGELGKAYPLLSEFGNFTMLFLVVWTIALYGHIFRHAFSTLFLSGVFMAILYNVLVSAIISSLMPGLQTS